MGRFGLWQTNLGTSPDSSKVTLSVSHRPHCTLRNFNTKQDVAETHPIVISKFSLFLSLSTDHCPLVSSQFYLHLTVATQYDLHEEGSIKNNRNIV